MVPVCFRYVSSVLKSYCMSGMGRFALELSANSLLYNFRKGGVEIDRSVVLSKSRIFVWFRKGDNYCKE